MISNSRFSTYALALAGLLVAAVVGQAQDSVDLQLTGKDKVKGTLRPATEREGFLCDVVRGTKILAVVKAKGKGGPQPRIDLIDVTQPDTPITTGEAQRNGQKIKNFPVPESGRYRLRVTGDGELDGDYQLKVRFKPNKKFRQDSTQDLGAGEEFEFEFPAPRGSSAKIVLKPARKSAFAPDLLAVVAPDDGEQALAGGKKAALDLAGTGGDYRVRFRNSGDAAGGWRILVKVKPPKSPTFDFDITPAGLAKQAVGGQQVAGAIFAGEGGTLVVPETGGSLDGSTLDVPGGALDLPTLITMSPGETFPAPNTTGAAGPAVEFGPSGTEFQIDATATLPFDPQFFDDPENDLGVVVRDGETGEIEVIDEGVVVNDDDTASFPVSHFSTFQIVSGLPRPLGGEFVEIAVGAEPLPGGAGRIEVARNQLSAARDLRTGNAFTRDVDARVLSYDLVSQGNVGVQRLTPSDGGTVDVFNDQFVDLLFGQDSQFLERGTSNDVFVRTGDTSGSRTASVLLRRSPEAPTSTGLAGAWHLTVWEFSAEVVRDNQGSLLGIGLGGVTQNAVVVLRADGRVGIASTVSGSRAPRPGSFTVSAPSDDVVLDMGLGADGDVEPVALSYCLDGNVLAGVSSTPPGSTEFSEQSVRVVFLTRLSNGARTSDLDGAFTVARLDAEAIATAGGIEFQSFVGQTAFDGQGTVVVNGLETRRLHDGTGQPTQIQDFLETTGRYTVNGIGQYREKGGSPVRGALTPRGELLLITAVQGRRVGIGFAVGGVTPDSPPDITEPSFEK